MLHLYNEILRNKNEPTNMCNNINESQKTLCWIKEYSEDIVYDCSIYILAKKKQVVGEKLNRGSVGYGDWLRKIWRNFLHRKKCSIFW